MAAFVAFAYSRRWHRVVWRNKLPSVALGVPLLIVAVIGGNYFLSPLWERSTVCEASPIAGADAGSEKCAEAAVAFTTGPSGTQPAESTLPCATEEPAFEASVVARGQFQNADDFHTGSGDALIIESTADTYTLRFENFSVRNGPDLYVYLSPNANGYADDSLELGTLKGTDGAFNYEVPAGTDISTYKSALVWCKQFGVLFTVAPLVEA